MSPILFLLFGLLALYLWLRGWWFAGLLAGFLYRYWQAPDPRSWLWTIAIAAGPWLFWKLISPQGRRFIADAHRQQEAQRLRHEEQLRPGREWRRLPRAERRRQWAEWRAARAT